MRASWMVQATVNEPFALLASFVAHYLELGADLIHLHLDSPHPEAEAAFAGHPKVRLTLCDAAYWAKAAPRGRPLGHPARQMVNARQVYAEMEQDWLLLCDADEYLVLEGDMGIRLAAQPEHLDFLRLHVAEKVVPPGLHPATVFDGTFRLSQPKGENLAEKIYGPELAPMLERILAAHDVGKSVIRRGGDFTLNLHLPVAKAPLPGQTTKNPAPSGRWMADAYLAHYDALTPLHYLIKLLGKHVGNQAIKDAGRKPGPRHASREVQIALAIAACEAEDPVAVTKVLHQLTPVSLAALKEFGLLRDLPIHPDAVARKHFPDLTLDFSPEAFDQALKVKHAAVLAQLGITAKV